MKKFPNRIYFSNNQTIPYLGSEHKIIHVESKQKLIELDNFNIYVYAPDNSISKTINWYINFYKGKSPKDLCKKDILDYLQNF